MSMPAPSGDDPDRAAALGATPVSVVTLYTKPGCHLCEDALAVLLRIQMQRPFELVQQDITADDELHRAYFERIPVVTVDGEHLCEYFVDELALRERLRSLS